MPLLAVAVGLLALDAFVLWLVLSGAPYIPTKKAGLEKIMACCGDVSGRKALDIGSGDGRIVIALARAGAEAHGVEINPLLVWWSRYNIRRAGLSGKAFIHRHNLWNFDCSGYQVVTLFGITHIMKRLEKKLRRELKPGARVVSIAFKFPTWPVAQKNEVVYAFDQT
ncbi:methyltransferase domain-containing protein [Candidatus Uhrbacteria bacterium]|nr:methyltransferase domain-containing protein [Candidatus Uhrbacteria bacterium]